MTTDAFANRSYSKVHHKKPDNQVLGDYGVGEWRDGAGKHHGTLKSIKTLNL